ncbi:magnesium transporter [bacterium]|nr:magnesium transporter [bacterium]
METNELVELEQIQAVLEDLIQQRHWTGLKHYCIELDSVVLADSLRHISTQDQALIFRLLPRDFGITTFEYLDIDSQTKLIKGLGQSQVAALLNEMSPDDRTALLEDLPGPVVKQLVDLLSPTERQIAQTLLGYPENSVGRVMTPDYITVRPEWTIVQSLDYIRTHGHDKESLDVIYVVDELGKLVDDIRINQVLTVPVTTFISDLMNDSFVALIVTDDKEDAATKFRRYDRTSLPVCDSDGFLVGIVTADDVIDIVAETDTRDIQQLGGVEALDDPYMQTPFWVMLQKRARWLIVLFIGEMLTATAMGFFQHEISKAVVLALFIPLIISSGGNSGSQASTLIVRAMALGELKNADWTKVLKRELLSGLALGSILGVIGFTRVVFVSGFTKLYGPHWLEIAITVGAALLGVVTWGTISGSMLPFILRKFNADPASSSAPFVATIVDVTGLIIYFSVAAIILHGTLL